MLRIFRHFLPLPALLLASLEFLIIAGFVHIIVAEGARTTDVAFSLASPQTALAASIAMVVVLAMIGIGLYKADVLLDYRVMVLKSFVLLSFVIPVLGMFVLFSPGPLPPQSGAWYLQLGLVWLLTLLFTRAIFTRITDVDALKKRLIVIGNGQKSARLRQIIENSASSRVKIVGHFAPGTAAVPAPAAGPVLDAADNAILALARSHRADEIVVASDDRRGLPTHQLLQCKTMGIDVVDFMSFLERETRTIDLDNLQPSWLIFSDGFRSGWFMATTKRLFDVAVSVGLLVATLPILLVTAVAIKLEDGGPVLYRQSRVGLFGRLFTVYKFRSMRVDAETDGRPQWAQNNDSRITRVGAIIRKLRIDELPQIMCVLKGDMSFIGPRPERPFFVQQLAASIPFYNERHSVKPGISGWAQINYPYGASLEDARQKLAYDLYYVKNRSVFLDLLILIQTIRVILFPDGAR